MDGFFRRLLKFIETWFRGPSDSNLSRKKFVVHGVSTNQQRPNLERDSGLSVRARQIVNQMFFRPPRRSKSFNVMGATRPKQCPLCRTQGGITRHNPRKWRCQACNHKWK